MAMAGFFLLIFVVAFLYSSVGHGGASGYLAVMAIFSFAPGEMKSTALLLNLFVSLIAFIQFSRKENINWLLFGLLIVSSIPFAFLGGLFGGNLKYYKQFLAFFLLIPVCRFWFFSNLKVYKKTDINILLVVFFGSIIGLLSGLIGIGGGIILSPLLIWLGWANVKQTAALSALFIFFNSLAGIAGQIVGYSFFGSINYYLFFFAIIGGIIGAYFGSNKFSDLWFKNILAVVIGIASIKLLLT